MHFEFYTQNEDVPTNNDHSKVTAADGVLTVFCNGMQSDSKYSGTPKTLTSEEFKQAFNGYPVNPSDPTDVAEVLGVTLTETGEDYYA